MIPKNCVSLMVMLIALVVAVSNSGCGSSTAPPPISVTISPSTQTVDESSSLTFSATALNDPANKGVNWRLFGLLPGAKLACPNAACGTLSNQTVTSVTYTAPSSIFGGGNSLSIQLIATSVTDNRKSAAASLTVVPAPLSIATTSLPNGTVNVSYSATLQLTGGTPPLTWSAAPGLPSGLSLSSDGTISGTPATPGSSCLVFTATDSSTPPQDPSQGLCIGINQPDSSHNGLLKGHYAFLINRLGHSQLKTFTQIATAGSFVADGAGNVTGVSDTNGSSLGVVANEPFTGTYALGADNRGTLSISTPTETVGTYAFSVGSMSASGVATKGRMIQFGAGLARPPAGEFELQDPSAFSNSAVSGSYAFELGRLIGVFTADGNRSITTGNSDDQPLTGTYNIAANSTDGRGTGTLTIAETTSDFTFYVVSASKMLMVSADPLTNLLFADGFNGQALKQSGGPFNSSSLSGTSVFRTGSAVVGQVLSADVTAGLETFDGRGTVTVLQDQNAGGTVTLDSTTSNSYSVSSDGRVTVTAAGAPVSVLYLVSAGTGFILNADGTTGLLEPQSAGPFTEASIGGNFFFGNLRTPLLPTVSSGVATLKAGTINLTSDINEDGTLIFGQSSQDTYAVAHNGRATTGSGKEVIYIISPTKFLMLDVNPTNMAPGITIIEQ
jgi:hypothetical protein